MLGNALGGFYTFLVNFDCCHSTQFSCFKFTSNPKLYIFFLHLSAPIISTVLEWEVGKQKAETSLYSSDPGLGLSNWCLCFSTGSHCLCGGSNQLLTLSWDTRVCAVSPLPSSLMLESLIFQPPSIPSEVKKGLAAFLSCDHLKGRCP